MRQKESGGPGWHRFDEVVSFHPDLIVMHYSTFRGPDTDDPRPPLKVFLRYFADLDTRFLIYTRSPEASVRHAVDSLMADVEAQHRGLLARITVFGTVHAPLFNPVIAAKEMVTADHIGQGRFGLNLVVGWNEGEFEIFGVESPGKTCCGKEGASKESTGAGEESSFKESAGVEIILGSQERLNRTAP